MITRFAIFVLIMFGFGLIHIWATGAILFYKNIPFTFNTLIRDGGLFFFSTALVIASAYSNSAAALKKTIDKFWLLLAWFIVFMLAIIGYTVEFTEAIACNRDACYSVYPYHISQWICLMVASFYSIYAALRSGLFKKYHYELV